MNTMIRMPIVTMLVLLSMVLILDDCNKKDAKDWADYAKDMTYPEDR